MADFVNTGPAFEAVGQLLARDVRASPNGAFLYAETRGRAIDCAIYKAAARRVLYRACSAGLVAAIDAVWRMEVPARRWRTMAYVVSAGRFTVDLRYLYQIDRRQDFAARSAAAVAARFGDRPVDRSDP